MKKIHILSIAILGLVYSCQQPVADQATIDAKVTEAYQAAKTTAENDAATECENAIAAKVKTVQDSMSHMSATQAAALLAKQQKDLKLAQAKVTADAAKLKKKAADATKAKATADAKAKADTKSKQVTAPIKDAAGNQQGSASGRDVVKEQTNIVKDAAGNQQGSAGGR